jgi:metal-dependent amidase/aminoacylase/carboxypeptidase family protein
MNARKELHVKYSGKSAHAGGNPWDGVNALDALVTSYNNVSVLRQQMLPDERAHCAFLDTPKVANVIPDTTRAYWQVRSPTLKGLNSLMGRVRKCVEAGAVATGCEVEIVEYVLFSILLLRNVRLMTAEMNCTRISRSTVPSVSGMRHTWARTGATYYHSMKRS